MYGNKLQYLQNKLRAYTLQEKMDENNCSEFWIKARFRIYNLHRRRQFSGCFFLIKFLRALNVSFLNSLGTIIQLSGPKME